MGLFPVGVVAIVVGAVLVLAGEGVQKPEDRNRTQKRVEGLSPMGGVMPVRAPVPLGKGGLGLAAGGGKDVESFSANLDAGYLPAPDSISYEGVFYRHRFKFPTDRCTAKLCPVVETGSDRSPFTGRKRYWLGLSFASNLTPEQLKERPPVGVVIVLDRSGSMSGGWGEYYYGGRGVGEGGKSKLEVAKEGVWAIISRLKPKDRVGIVVFNQRAVQLLPLTPVEKLDRRMLKLLLDRLTPGGGTNLGAGLETGLRMLGVGAGEEGPAGSTAAEAAALLRGSGPQRGGRLVVLTDEMPNIGLLSGEGFRRLLKEGVKRGVYTTIIGIGVDANPRLAKEVAQLPGANYFSVTTPDQFWRRVVTELDYWIYPYLFNLQLLFKSPNSEVVGLYGTGKPVEGGRLLEIPTLFPSPTDQNGTKGGIVVAELKVKGGGVPEGVVELRYRDRFGQPGRVVGQFQFRPGLYFSSPALEKGVLLVDFVSLVKGWLREANSRCRGSGPEPVGERFGIVPPPPGPAHSQWERGSCPIEVTPQECRVFREFLDHFVAEERKLGDSSLKLEEEELREILDYCPSREGEEGGGSRE